MENKTNKLLFSYSNRHIIDYSIHLSFQTNILKKKNAFKGQCVPLNFQKYHSNISNTGADLKSFNFRNFK